MPGTYIIPIEVDSLKLQNKKILYTVMKDTKKNRLRLFIVIEHYSSIKHSKFMCALKQPLFLQHNVRLCDKESPPLRAVYCLSL